MGGDAGGVLGQRRGGGAARVGPRHGRGVVVLTTAQSREKREGRKREGEAFPILLSLGQHPREERGKGEKG
jgi:hypothetical protein